MKVKFRIILYLLAIGLFIGCNEVNNKIDSNENESKIKLAAQVWAAIVVFAQREQALRSASISSACTATSADSG